jgi:RHS repeat-associated protein
MIKLRIASLLTCLIVACAAGYAPVVLADVGSSGANLGEVDTGRDASQKSAGPIVYATGNLIVPETDFASEGEMGLYLKRTFNNYWGGVGIFGAKWQSNFDYKLSFTTSASTDPCYPKPGGVCTTAPTGTIPLWAHLPDGRRIEYLYNTSLALWQEVKPSPISTIVRNGDGTYTLTNATHGIEHYSAKGYVLSIVNAQNVGWTFAYDANNYLQTATHTNGRTVHFTWTGNQLTTVTDPAGNTHTYTYLVDRLGTGLNVLSSTTTNQPGGPSSVIHYFYEDSRYLGGLTGKDYDGTRYSTYGYDAGSYAISTSLGAAGTMAHFTYAYTPGANNTLTVVETSPLGRQTTYTFVNGVVTNTSATGGANIGNASKTHTYDGNGYDFQVTDFNGNLTIYTYAANGQLQQMVEGSGTSAARTTQYQWDPDLTRNRLTKVTVGSDHEIDYTYDPVTQRMASVTTKNLSANGIANQTHTTTYTYTNNTTNGMLATMVVDGPVAGTGDAVTYQYDVMGNLVSVTNSLGQAVTFSLYTAMGRAGQVTGANGDTTAYTYNVRGEVIDVQTFPNGVSVHTAYTYDPTGLMTGVTTPDGVLENYTYDDTRTLTSKFRMANGTISGGADQEAEVYFYDANQDLIETDDYARTGLLFTTTRKLIRTCDGLGRTWTVGGNNGQNIRTTYDLNGNPLTVTDSLNHVSSYQYDALNRKINSVDAKNGITAYSYDAGSRVSAVTDPRGLVTSYVYDGFGLLWARSSPDTLNVSFTYDTAGRRATVTFASGAVNSYTYDALSRLVKISHGTPAQTFTYDSCTNGKGRLCGTSDNNTATPYSLTNTYTPEGWIASQSSSIKSSSTSGIAVYNTSYVYDSMGRVTGVTYPNGQIANYAYASGKLSALTVTVNGVISNVATGLTYQPYAGSAGWAYGNGLVRGNTFDLDGRLTGISTTVPASTVLQSLTYQFDADSRITALTNGVTPSLTQSFGYDELTRLTAVTSGSGNGSWAYDANGSRTLQTGGVTDNVSPYSNRLTSLSGATTRSFVYSGVANVSRTSETNSNGTLNYSYDVYNRLKGVSSTYGVNASYQVDPQGRRIFKVVGAAANKTTTHFVYTADSILLTEMQATSSGSTQTNYLWMGGQLVGMVRNNTVYMIHTDHLGRPEIVTSPTQAVVWRASNFAFDRTVTLDTVGGLNIGFPGQYYDAETNLWNNGFRDYDATVGSYIESDPLGLAAGINTFAYVGGNPVSGFDPFGLDKITINLYGSWPNHVGESINGGDSQGFYSDRNVSNLANFFGVTSTGSVLLDRGAGNQNAPISSITLDVSAEQAAAGSAYWSSIDGTTYGVWTFDCANAVEGSLLAMGFTNVPSSNLPGDVMEWAKETAVRQELSAMNLAGDISQIPVVFRDVGGAKDTYIPGSTSEALESMAAFIGWQQSPEYDEEVMESERKFTNVTGKVQ